MGGPGVGGLAVGCDAELVVDEAGVVLFECQRRVWGPRPVRTISVAGAVELHNHSIVAAQVAACLHGLKAYVHVGSEKEFASFDSYATASRQAVGRQALRPKRGLASEVESIRLATTYQKPDNGFLYPEPYCSCALDQ